LKFEAPQLQNPAFFPFLSFQGPSLTLERGFHNLKLQTSNLELFVFKIFPVIFALLLKNRTMAVTRLKRKGRKDKAKSAVRRQSLKIQNFQPVIKNVDVEKIKEEFKAKAKKG